MEAVQELYRLYMNEIKLNRERGAIGTVLAAELKIFFNRALTEKITNYEWLKSKFYKMKSPILQTRIKF